MRQRNVVLLVFHTSSKNFLNIFLITGHRQNIAHNAKTTNTKRKNGSVSRTSRRSNNFSLYTTATCFYYSIRLTVATFNFYRNYFSSG